MQENESLREFVKRFDQTVLQVEAYSMDAVLQIFKCSICPGILFFESLAKKPPTTMDDLFRRASKYSMLILQPTLLLIRSQLVSQLIHVLSIVHDSGAI